MHRTLILLALSGLVAACGGGAGTEVTTHDDQSPALNGDAPGNDSQTPATSDQAPLNETQQPGMNDQAPSGGTIIGACVGTTTPIEFLQILQDAACAQVIQCPSGPQGQNYWAEFCTYMRDCVANPMQCELTLDESIPVCPASVESCVTAAFESLGCDATGEDWENLDLSAIPECAGIMIEAESPSPEPDPITNDLGGGGTGA